MVDAQDDGFHEIQLNGKQLVFLFMAATVVSVVIFLCGVLVGRGVRAERSLTADAGSASSTTETTPPPATTPPSTPPPAGSDPTKAAPPPADDLTYFDRLDKGNAAPEQLKAGSEKPAAEKRAAAAKPAAPPPSAIAQKPPAVPPSEPAPTPAAAAEPSNAGFAVQIAALNVRSEAEAIAKHLSSKGYAAYVVSPASGTPAVYRVRVGKFTTRREADNIATKLQKEEQYKPWVTR